MVKVDKLRERDSETYQDCKAEKNDVGEEVSRLGETAGLRLEAARVRPYLIIHEYDEYLQRAQRRLTKVGIKEYANASASHPKWGDKPPYLWQWKFEYPWQVKHDSASTNDVAIYEQRCAKR